MAGESAGIIYSEIRVKLDALQGDLKQVSGLLKGMETQAGQAGGKVGAQFQNMGKQVGGAMTNMSKTAIGQFSGMLQGMQKAIMAAPIVGMILMIVGAVKQLFTGVADWIGRTAESYHKHQVELQKLNATLTATGSAAWISTRQLKDMATEITNSTGVATEKIMAMQASLLRFTSITGETFDRASKAAVDMAAAMGTDPVSAAQTLGKALEDPEKGMALLARQGVVLTAQQKEMVTQFMATGDVASAQGVILGQMEKTYGGVAKAMNEVDSAGRLEAATKRLEVAQGESTSKIVTWWQNVRAGWKEARAEAVELENALKKTEKADYKNLTAQVEKLYEDLKNATTEAERIAIRELIVKGRLELNRTDAEVELAKAKKSLQDYQTMLQSQGVYVDEALDPEIQKLKEVIAERESALKQIDGYIAKTGEEAAARQRQLAEETKQMGLVEEQTKALKTAEETRIKTLEEIKRAQDAGLITAAEAYSKQQAAYRSESESINQIISATNRLSITQGIALKEREALQKKLNQSMVEATDAMNAQKAATLDPKQLAEYVAAQVKAMKDRERTMTDLHNIEMQNTSLSVQARKKLEEDYNKSIMQLYQGTWTSINNFAQEHGMQWSKNPATFASIQFITDKIGGIKDGFKEIAEAEKAAAQEKKMAKTIQDLQDDYLRLTGTVEQVRAMEKQRHIEAIIATEEYKNASDDTKEKVMEAINAIYDHSVSKNPWQKMGEAVAQYGSQVASIISAGLQMWADSVTRETEIQKKRLEERVRLEKEALDEDYRNKLYYAGLAEATSAAQWEAELARVQDTLDERLIALTEESLQRARIEEEYAAEKKRIDEEAAKEKAKLEYKAAMATWQMNLLNAIVGGAMAVINGLNTQPFMPVGIAMGALAATLSALQIATVASNKPKMAQFATGGIVGGNSFSGDNVPIWVNSGERILTVEDQKLLSDFLKGAAVRGDSRGSAQEPINVTIPIYLDRRKIGEAIAEDINNRQYAIKADSFV